MSELRGKRVLFLFSTLSLGGSERQALLLARHLRGLGAEPLVWGLSPARDGLLERACAELDVLPRYVRCGEPLWRLRRGVGLTRFALYLRLARIDLLLPSCHVPNLVAGLSWRAGGARGCVWNQRDEGRGLTGSRLQRLAARLTPCYVSNSRHGADALAARLGLPRERIQHVPNGVELAPPQRERAQVRDELGLAPEVPTALMLASLSHTKDHPTLLKAWAQLDPSEGPRPTLLLAGKEADGGPRLRALAAGLGLGDSVRFLGAVEDVASLLGAADLLVHSSDLEGVPNAVLEGMASGLPVLASDSPGPREALEDPRQLVPASDPAALAQRLRALLADPELRAELGARNQARAKAEFAAARCAERWTKLLERLAAVASPRRPHSHTSSE